VSSRILLKAWRRNKEAGASKSLLPILCFTKDAQGKELLNAMATACIGEDGNNICFQVLGCLSVALSPKPCSKKDTTELEIQIESKTRESLRLTSHQRPH